MCLPQGLGVFFQRVSFPLHPLFILNSLEVLVKAFSTLSTSSSSKSSVVFGEIFQRAWQKISRFFTESTEPQIWQTHGPDHQIVWHVYDPATGHTVCFASEAEIRAWLEHRYYL